jgi:transcriptional regulator with XRE-family HTH domain
MQVRKLEVITSEQIRAARAALGWSASELAAECGLSLRTIANFESEAGVTQTRRSSMLAIKSALEAAGIEFIGTPGDAPGIRIHRLGTD